jgi:glycosyltransferase 2 family protein
LLASARAVTLGPGSDRCGDDKKARPACSEVGPEVRRMARPRWQRLTIAAVKSAVAVVVLWEVGRHVLHTWNDLGDRRIALRFEPLWLVGSGLLYLAGLSACGRFYERILHESPTPIGLIPALRAYLVSHLGKYVPGKAMVVVVRAGLVVPFGARASTAAIATFYETLVMMAAGGLLAAAGFVTAAGSDRVAIVLPGWGPVEFPVYGLAALSGLGLGLAFLAVVLPPVFGRLAGLISLPIPGVGPEALPRLSARLLGQGLFWSSAGWVLLGLSQLAVVRAFDPDGAKALVAQGLVPVVIASVALATVAGFVVAVLPGGLGVREGVLMSALAPALGSDRSVVAALALRLVWVAAELAAAVVLVPLVRSPRDPVKPPLEAGPSPS